MKLHVRTILKITGVVMMVIGIAMLPSFLVSLFSDGPDIWKPFLMGMLGVILLGGIIFYFTRMGNAVLQRRDGFLMAVLCWLITAMVGAVPFVVTGVLPNPIDAFFESMSGFTTTGATVISDVEVVPRGILFWRSFTHWIGGIGIFVFAIGLLPSLGINGQDVMSTDTPTLSIGKILPKVTDIMRTLYIVYLIFTVLETILLLFGGMSLFDALVFTFGSVGTGGFAPYNDSVAHFNSSYISVVIMIFMFVSSINFNLYFLSLKRKFFAFSNDIEFWYYTTMIAVSTIIITITLLITSPIGDKSTHLLDAAFQTVSVISTTGYSTCNYMNWPLFCQLILLILMFIGGCSISTSGGVKVIRIVVIIKYIKYGIHTRLHPNSVEPITINNKVASSDTVSGVTYHIFLYIALMFAGAFIISFENYDIETTFSAIITCLGNIGVAFGDIGTGGLFADFNMVSKFTCSIAMLAGRLELYTFFILLTPRFWNADH